MNGGGRSVQRVGGGRGGTGEEGRDPRKVGDRSSRTHSQVGQRWEGSSGGLPKVEPQLSAKFSARRSVLPLPPHPQGQWASVPGAPPKRAHRGLQPGCLAWGCGQGVRGWAGQSGGTPPLGVATERRAWPGLLRVWSALGPFLAIFGCLLCPFPLERAVDQQSVYLGSAASPWEAASSDPQAPGEDQRRLPQGPPPPAWLSPPTPPGRPGRGRQAGSPFSAPPAWTRVQPEGPVAAGKVQLVAPRLPLCQSRRPKTPGPPKTATSSSPSAPPLLHGRRAVTGPHASKGDRAFTSSLWSPFRALFSVLGGVLPCGKGLAGRGSRWPHFR